MDFGGLQNFRVVTTAFYALSFQCGMMTCSNFKLCLTNSWLVSKVGGFKIL